MVLATLMLSACAFSVLLFNHESPLGGLSPGLRLILMGIAMGTTATAIICSPSVALGNELFDPKS